MDSFEIILDFHHNSNKNVCVQVRTNVDVLNNPFDGKIMFIVLTHRHFNTWEVETCLKMDQTEKPLDEASCPANDGDEGDDVDDLLNLVGLDWPADNVDLIDLESLNI